MKNITCKWVQTKRRLILYNDDTIVAIATASGIGSISIVRVSGAKALEIALKISQKLL